MFNPLITKEIIQGVVLELGAIITSYYQHGDIVLTLNHVDEVDKGLLSRFVGMLTDSRSFLSYPRHEYFRRTLCNLVGRDVENGEIPVSEMERVNQMIEDISYNNAKNFFKF